ncbi:hypothetical protein CLV63_102118 [Murinocardiopsis flavida]|uniref:Uncharacterized protein n=1 Tax=Murinocardiopsis flavida TaxID=645275 RepID=A0A2P8DS06_9ACTN|nr:hypothetical protein [Murinocardiopsis flavida]PSK99991.1 hypothetical protein CLV63_102118 [Murinocardiopsis flavida]
MPPVSEDIEVFTTKPSASEATFKKGGPIQAKTGESKAIIFYAPKLENIGYIDNTGSDSVTSYSKAIATGFVFSMQQTISTEQAIEFNAEFVKGSFKLTMSLTFSQQWSKVTTETYTFQVPSGKKAFTYQGYIQLATLVHTHSSNTYAFEAYGGNLYTPALVTRNSPILPA